MSFMAYCHAMGPTEFQGNEGGHDQPTLGALEFVLKLRAMSRALQSFLIMQARASRLGLLEYLLLARAADQGGVTARAAGRELTLSTGTMTGLIDRLEQDDLIRRHPHPTDRRVLLLQATPRGREIMDRSVGPLLADLTALANSLPAEQQALLGAFMDQVAERVRDETMAEPSSADGRPARRGTPQRPRAAPTVAKT